MSSGSGKPGEGTAVGLGDLDDTAEEAMAR